MPEDEDSGRETETASTRWWLTNDSIAIYLLLTFPIVVMAGSLRTVPVDLDLLPQSVRLTYLFAVGVAVAWTFGRDAVEAWRGGDE